MSSLAPASLEPVGGATLAGRGPVVLPLTGARLQALAGPAGVERLLVWGSGLVGAVRFEPPLPADARVRVTPNRLELVWPSGRLTVSALPTTPAVVLRGWGDLPDLRVAPPRALPPGFAHRATLRRLGDGWGVASAWGELVVRAAGAEIAARGRLSWRRAGLAVVAAGADRAEAEGAAAALLADPGDPAAELEAHQSELADVLHVAGDDVLQSLFVHGLHAARTARKELPGGRFAGLAAGVGYALPPRTYYRDGYWTLQALLPRWPEVAREQLLLLARELPASGPEAGTAPSGVVVASPAGERVWRARRAADPALAADHPRDGVWWADHTDASLLFALLACDVAAWIGDPGLFATRVDGATIGARVAAALERAHGACDASGLPVKPPHDRDWADNVFRGGYVAYDVGLYHGALGRVADLVAGERPADAARYRARAAALREGARRHLWDEARRYFVDFRTPEGRAEAHLAIDTLTALRFGLADDAQAARVLAAMRARLETRHNGEQPWGDWGVMNVFPPYAPWVRRRGKSRFAYRYHDGADWPYWDGIYAEERLRRGLGGWRYPLTRWWTYGLAQGRAAPVEYASPPYAPGSPSNAWSAMPAAAMLFGGYGLTPAGTTRRPPWGPATLRVRAADGRLVAVRHDAPDAAPTLEVDDG
ncbi:MAG: trehalase family glycosidase [Trueperaceae bacterium]|nr:trehalase family glycosidase [Trueperaceae bacterium]